MPVVCWASISQDIGVRLRAASLRVVSEAAG